MDTTTEIYLIEEVVLTNITSTNKPSIKTEQKVEKKVSAHMSAFKEEVMREIEDQRI